MVEIRINLSKTHAMFIVCAVIILTAVIFVNAQSGAPNPGHSANQIGSGTMIGPIAIDASGETLGGFAVYDSGGAVSGRQVVINPDGVELTEGTLRISRTLGDGNGETLAIEVSNGDVCIGNQCKSKFSGCSNLGRFGEGALINIPPQCQNENLCTIIARDFGGNFQRATHYFMKGKKFMSAEINGGQLVNGDLDDSISTIVTHRVLDNDANDRWEADCPGISGSCIELWVCGDFVSTI